MASAPDSRTIPTHPASAPLTAAVARGDRAAVGRFHDLWHDRVHALAHRLLHNRSEELPEVVQEVMLRVLSSMPQLEEERAVAGWMARTVYSVVIDRTRARSRRRRHETAAAVPCNAEQPRTGLDPAVGQEELEWLREELLRLPETDRRLLLDRYAGDLTLEQLGATRNMTGNAAAGRLRRSLNRLRAAARKSFDD